MEKVKVPSVYKFRIYPSGKNPETIKAHQMWLFEFMKQGCFFYNKCLETYNKYYDDRIAAWRELRKTEAGLKEIADFRENKKKVQQYNRDVLAYNKENKSIKLRKEKLPIPVHPNEPYMNDMDLYRESGTWEGFDLLPSGVRSALIRKLSTVLKAYFDKNKKAIESGAAPKKPRKDGRFDNWPHFTKLSDFLTIPIQWKAGIDFSQIFYNDSGEIIRARVKIGVNKNVHYYYVNFDRPLPKWKDDKKPVFSLTRNTTNTMFNILIPVPENETEIRYSVTGKEVGIDLGLKHFANTSDGDFFDLFSRQERANIIATWMRKQNLMSNKPCHKQPRKERSKSYWKAHADYRNYEDYLKRLKQDRMYCLANKLVEKYDTIYIGKMDLAELMKKKKKREVKVEKNKWLKAKHKRAMRRNFAWGSMYTFIQILKHVAKKNKKTVVEVDERYSTMLCSGCHAVVEKDLSIRTHRCPECGLVLDRDHNAAINMITLGKMNPEERSDFNKMIQKKRSLAQKKELSANLEKIENTGGFAQMEIIAD